MATRKSVFVYSSEFEKFAYPESCPFNVSRVPRLWKILKSIGLLSGNGISEMAPKPAERVALKKFHTARYRSEQGGLIWRYNTDTRAV